MSGRPLKRQPLRTCIVCRREASKRELVRIVRKTDGTIHVDPTGKVPGRGAYLCRRRACWQSALARKSIAVALKTELAAEDQARIAEYAAQLPAEDTAET